MRLLLLLVLVVAAASAAGTASASGDPLCDPAMPLDVVTCEVVVYTACATDPDVADYSLRHVMRCAKVQV